MDFCKNCSYLKNLKKTREWDDVRGHCVVHQYKCELDNTIIECFSEAHLSECGCSCYKEQLEQLTLFDFMK